MINPKKTGLDPYRAVLKDEEPKKKTSQSGAKAPLTVDQREQGELTYLEKTYGEAAKRDAAAHQAAVKAQETARQSANRQAYIGSELMQKYLPQYQAMQGTGGMGTSQTDAAAAMNAYFGQVSENNAGYAENVAALEQAKAERDAQRESELRDKKYDAVSRYDYERQQMAEEESTGLLDTMAGRKKSFTGSDEKISPEDYQNLWDFYTANESRLTEAGKRNAQDMLAEYKMAIRDAEEQAAMDRNKYINKGVVLSGGLSDYGKVGNNFKVKDAAGNEYAVELGEQVGDQEVIDMADRAESGEIFAYGGKLYLKKDHAVYEVNRREQTKHEQYENLYNLYFGNGQGGEEQDAVAVSEGQKVLAEDLPLTVTKGARHPVGEVFRYNGKMYVKEADGKFYKIG